MAHPDKTVIRKLIASKDLDWFVCLQIPENDEKSNVYLNHFDIKANKQVCCVEYLTLNSTGQSNSRWSQIQQDDRCLQGPKGRLCSWSEQNHWH